MNIDQHRQAEIWGFKRHSRCGLTIPEEKDIATRYLNGETFSDMADELNMSRNWLWRLATNVYGVETYQTTGYPKQYDLDIDTFKNIHSEKPMYALGLIYSDGHITQDKYTLTFASIDKEQVENLKNCLGSTHKPYVAYKDDPDKSTQYHLEIGYEPMIDDLTEYVEEMSKNQYDINQEIVESDHFNHFLRGFLDGDGSVGKESKNIVFTGKKELMEDLKESIRINYGIEDSGMSKVVGGHIKKDSDVYHLSYCKVNACRKLYKIMYDNAEYFLSRKKDAFINHFGKI